MLIALTRAVPAAISDCELTHLARTPIDYPRAVREHELYEQALEQMGCRVERLPAAPDLPDSVFVEDAAVVFDDVAVIARPGAASRRPEVATVEPALRKYRRLVRIQPPGTLDGGDVLVTPAAVFVGISGRTNADGARQLAGFTHQQVVPVTVTGCLHLKSAVTAVGGRRLVINPAWVAAANFQGFECIEVDPAEPAAANVLLANGHVLSADEHPRTRKRLEACGIVTITVPAGELAKAEGGLTCGSLIVSISS